MKLIPANRIIIVKYSGRKGAFESILRQAKLDLPKHKANLSSNLNVFQSSFAINDDKNIFKN